MSKDVAGNDDTIKSIYLFPDHPYIAMLSKMQPYIHDINSLLRSCTQEALPKLIDEKMILVGTLPRFDHHFNIAPTSSDRNEADAVLFEEMLRDTVNELGIDRYIGKRSPPSGLPLLVQSPVPMPLS